MSEWTIDADFRFNGGERDGMHGESGYTWAEFTAKARPPCPACGDPIEVAAVECRDGDGRNLFIPGSVSCRNGCQPPR